MAPNLYRDLDSEEDFVGRLEALLAKEGLGSNPSREAIEKVKHRLEAARDMDGIELRCAR